LSSWLNRVALCYHIEVSELLEHDLGHGQVDDLDTAPPLALLAMLSQRSGIELNRLRCMSFAGWVPWLLDSLDDQIPDALETYAFQLSVLLPTHRRKTRSITSWRAWLPSQPIHRACPLCRPTHGQRRDCDDGPAYLAGTDDRPCGAAAPTHPCRIVVSAATHAAR
jgi:hypothetical protein